MKTRPHDPLRLDVAAFARDGGRLEGRFALGELERLASLAMPVDAPAAEVEWQADGERVAAAGEAQTWLRLRAATTLALQCQRCLAPVATPLAVDRRIRFVRDEATAEALDAELDDDVLALPRALDLRALVEDELLLALPIVPRHGHCPEPLPASAGEAEAPPRESPFAALEALKKAGGG